MPDYSIRFDNVVTQIKALGDVKRKLGDCEIRLNSLLNKVNGGNDALSSVIAALVDGNAIFGPIKKKLKDCAASLNKDISDINKLTAGMGSEHISFFSLSQAAVFTTILGGYSRTEGNAAKVFEDERIPDLKFAIASAVSAAAATASAATAAERVPSDAQPPATEHPESQHGGTSIHPVGGKAGATITAEYLKYPTKPEVHTGIDFGGTKGTPILSTYSGKVIRSEFYTNNGKPSYGNLVVVECIVNGKKVNIYFAHMDSRNVKVGDEIAAGQQLGTLGATGNATGPHLHYEVRVDGKHVDPLTYLPK